MKGHPLFRLFWYAADVLLLVSLAMALYGAAWEFSMRNYLKGFSDAVVPYADSPAEKVDAILAWIKIGPERRTTFDPDALNPRDPRVTLNYAQLLDVCGTATNAFVNLASSSGLKARRLLLLDGHRNSKHVVAEVYLDGEWAVVDPTYRILYRDSTGHFLTRTELENPDTLRMATRAIPDYPSTYTYESTAHVHLSRLPLVGLDLRSMLNFVWPSWETSIDWTLLLERDSFAMMFFSILFLGFVIVFRLVLSWYGIHRLDIARTRLRDQVVRAGGQLLSSPK